ncbi:MAG: ABC transporter substrate-binding protein [Dehalococcoidia bacterium]
MSTNWLFKGRGAALLFLAGLMVIAAVACGDEDPTPTQQTDPTNTPTGGGADPTATPDGGDPATATPGGDETATATPQSGATATPPTGGGDGPQGSITRAFRQLESVYGIGYVGPYRTSATNQLGGVEEHLFRYENGDPMTPEIVESWAVDPAGTKTTWTIKQGIPFQAPRGFENEDFGEINAHEIVEWLNRSNSTTNADSTYGDAGDFAAIFLEADEIDEYTLEIGLVSPVYFCLPVSQFGCLSADRGPHKVTTADTKGVDWAREHHVGTGPFVQGQCTPGDRCTIHAVEEHWRQVADVAEITGVQVPETGTQLAMLQNGQIDLVEIDFQQVPALLDDGFQFIETMPGAFVGASILWSGNLWEETHARTGVALNPWDSPVYAQDYAWLGDPWQEEYPDRVQYEDTNNPDGMTDMEQARLVRLALGLAIDRDAINEVLLNDLGTPIYSEYMGPEYPGWDPDRDTGVWDWLGERIDAEDTMQPVDWRLDDGNLEEADRLLTEAGFPRDGSGNRPEFGTLVLQTYPAEVGVVAMEVGDNVISTWANLGIDVEGLQEDYGGVISPRMRVREQFNPVIKNGDVHSNVYPLDWPMPTVDTSSSRPGWGVAFESQPGAEWLFEILGEQDPTRREELHLDWVDYSLYWQQYAGLFQIPKGIMGNDRIESWEGYSQHYSNISRNAEFIKLRR